MAAVYRHYAKPDRKTSRKKIEAFPGQPGKASIHKYGGSQSAAKYLTE
jgi:hypothetical protein